MLFGGFWRFCNPWCMQMHPHKTTNIARKASLVTKSSSWEWHQTFEPCVDPGLHQDNTRKSIRNHRATAETPKIFQNKIKTRNTRTLTKTQPLKNKKTSRSQTTKADRFARTAACAPWVLPWWMMTTMWIRCTCSVPWSCFLFLLIALLKGKFGITGLLCFCLAIFVIF